MLSIHSKTINISTKINPKNIMLSKTKKIKLQMDTQYDTVYLCHVTTLKTSL